MSGSRDTVGELLLLLESSGGREKLARLVQFSSKYLKWKEETEKARNQKSIQMWENIENNMITIQKFLNLFKTIAVLRAFHRLLPHSTSELSIPLFFQLSGKIVGFANLVLDHATYAEKLGIWIPDQPTLVAVNKLASLTWLADILCSTFEHLALLSSLHTPKNQYAAIAASSTPTETTLILAPSSNPSTLALSASTRVILRNLFDLPIAMDGSGIKVFKGLQSGHFGLLGTISSLLAIYDMWPTVVEKA